MKSAEKGNDIMKSQAKNETKVAMPSDYATWIADLKKRFRATQIKAVVEVILPQVVAKSSRGKRQQLVDDNEKLGLPMGITDYELKRILPTQAQLAKCYADAEVQIRRRKAQRSIVDGAPARPSLRAVATPQPNREETLK